MLVVIRADATTTSGVGHAMRCLAIAEELADQGQRIHWIGDLGSQPWLESKVSNIAGSITAPAGSDSDQADQVLRVNPDMIFVDSYALGKDFCSPLQRHRNTLIAIVDSASRLTPADLYVAPSVEAISQDVVGDTPILQGVQFVLIRKELRQIKERMGDLSRRNRAESRSRRVAVLMGGTDIAGMAPRIVDSLLALAVPVRINAVPRPMTSKPVPPPIQNSGSSSVTWWNAGENIYPQIAGADLVISAAGVSSWELLYLGLTLALVQVADNQASNYHWMTAGGHAWGIGESNGLQDPQHLEDALRKLMEFDLEITRNPQPIVDGLGVRRVVNAALRLAREREE